MGRMMCRIQTLSEGTRAQVCGSLWELFKSISVSSSYENKEHFFQNFKKIVRFAKNSSSHELSN